jgi:uncharacterized protein (TIGR01777 family)
MKYVIAGGTGAVGRRVADDAASRGHEVVILTRSPRADLPHRQVRWDGRTVGDWAEELAGAVVVNLAGELVDRPPTAANVALLRRSRVEPTQALVAAATAATVRPHLWLQMSTLAIYGDAGQVVIDEGHPPADGPAQMAGVARPWEEAASASPADRTVTMRTGIILEPGSVALDRLVRLARWGLGGRMGRGDQWISWVHVEDFLAALRFIETHSELSGVVHLTSPEPVQNREMMAALRHALHRPASPPTPRVLVHVGAFLMRTDPALALTGRRCVPRRLLDTGFEFRHPTFDGALADLLGVTPAPRRADHAQAIR